jgi:hypothetical protein
VATAEPLCFPPRRRVDWGRFFQVVMGQAHALGIASDAPWASCASFYGPEDVPLKVKPSIVMTAEVVGRLDTDEGGLGQSRTAAHGAHDRRLREDGESS